MISLESLRTVNAKVIQAFNAMPAANPLTLTHHGLDSSEDTPARKTVAAVFARRSHSQNSNAPETVDHFPRNVRVSVDSSGIQFRIKKRSQLLECLIELSLLRLRDPRIRHHPIGNEVSGKKSFNETKRLRAGEQ